MEGEVELVLKGLMPESWVEESNIWRKQMYKHAQTNKRNSTEKGSGDGNTNYPKYS